MSEFPHPVRRWAIVIVALAIFLVAGLLGGPGNSADIAAIRGLAAERAAHGGLTIAAIDVTAVGGAPGMVAILALVVGGLCIARRWRDAAAFGAVVLVGRAMVEGVKLLADRPRPHFGPWPVQVSSFSFPSAHAANSMITGLAIALMIVPVRYRLVAVAAAVCLSLLIGATRPFLGVHWSSDVMGGWAFGIAWVVSLATAYDYWRASRATRAG